MLDKAKGMVESEEILECKEVVLIRSLPSERLGLTLSYEISEDLHSPVTIFISQIEEGGLAHRDGRLRPGDQVILLNGAEIEDQAKFKRTLVTEKSIQLTVLRSENKAMGVDASWVSKWKHLFRAGSQSASNTPTTTRKLTSDRIRSRSQNRTDTRICQPFTTPQPRRRTRLDGTSSPTKLFEPCSKITELPHDAPHYYDNDIYYELNSSLLNNSNSSSSSSAYNTGDSNRSTPEKPQQDDDDINDSLSILSVMESSRYNDMESSLFGKSDIFDRKPSKRDELVEQVDRSNLQQTIETQQKKLLSELAKVERTGSVVKFDDQSKDRPDNKESEWVVKCRPDGTKYIARRPVRSKMLREREKKIYEERGLTTDDDVQSEWKVGRYWTKSERKKHLEKSKDRKKKREVILKKRDLVQRQKTEVDQVIELGRKKLMKNRQKTVYDGFMSLQEMLTHGFVIDESANPLFTVTTV